MSNEAPVSISLNTSSVKTSIPVIADGHQVRSRLAKIAQLEPKDGKGANIGGQVIGGLLFEYHTLEPAPTTDGGQVKPGFPIFERIMFYDKDTPMGEMPERVAQRISKHIDAFLGTGDVDDKKGKPARPEFTGETVAAMIGKEAFLKLKAKTGEYEGNDVSKLTFPGDLTA